MTIEDKNDIINHASRLKWACRRGMLELDVLLGNFLKDRYFTLSSADKNQFIKLLSLNDPQIFSWLMGHEEPEEIDFKRIITMIRMHARL